jgi:hypothetical protein
MVPREGALKMTTLEKLQAAYLKVEEAVKLLQGTEYGLLADRAEELLAALGKAVHAEEAA